MSAETRIRALFTKADIRVDGDRPWDVQVHNPQLYSRVLVQGSVGLGEAYMDGWWDCERLDHFFTRLLRFDHEIPLGIPVVIDFIRSWFTNRQTQVRSKQVADRHYNLGNDLYIRMLDRNMQYTCAYWKDAQHLDDAQENKLDLICRKLYLEPGMRVLELGGGFGGLARYIAANRGCEVVSYNIAAEQVKYAREICDGLPVEIVHADYRTATGTFDRVVSIGLCEHVGPKNYRSFLELAHDRMTDEGIFLLHTIGNMTTRRVSDPWIRKYIFPEGHLPSPAQMGDAMDGLFAMEDWHNFGPDYARTLMAWHQNFAEHWDELKSNFDDRFYRMWSYYLLACAGGFRSRRLQLWQLVLSKGLPEGYVPVR